MSLNLFQSEKLKKNRNGCLRSEPLIVINYTEYIREEGRAFQAEETQGIWALN